MLSHPDLLTITYLWYDVHRNLHSFPTRRSSDLHGACLGASAHVCSRVRAKTAIFQGIDHESRRRKRGEERDRKSTRLNSSHLGISYAVFCLKKKKLQRKQSDVSETSQPPLYPTK